MTSDQTRKEERASGRAGGRHYRGKENPSGVNLRGLVGTSKSIAREGGEEQ